MKKLLFVFTLLLWLANAYAHDVEYKLPLQKFCEINIGKSVKLYMDVQQGNHFPATRKGIVTHCKYGFAILLESSSGEDRSQIYSYNQILFVVGDVKYD